MSILFNNLSNNFETEKEIDNYTCYGYFTSIVSENSLKQFFADRISEIKPCANFDVRITYHKFIFTKVLCTIRFVVTSFPSNFPFLCQNAVLKLLDDIPLKAWGRQYSCIETYNWINVTDNYQVRLKFPAVATQTWFVEVKIYCEVPFLNLSVPVNIVCNITEDGGYRWRINNPDACLFPKHKIIDFNSKKIEFHKETDETLIQLHLFYMIEQLAYKNLDVTPEEFNNLINNLENSVNLFNHTEVALLVLSVVENMVRLLNRMTIDFYSINYIFRPFTYWIKALQNIPWKLEFETNLSMKVIGESNKEIEIFQLFLWLIVKVIDNNNFEVLVFCMDLPDPKYLILTEKKVYPSCLAFVLMKGSTTTDKPIKKQVVLKFSIKEPRKIVNKTCIQIHNNKITNRTCVLTVDAVTDMFICYCDYINTIYTVEGNSNIEHMVPTQPNNIIFNRKAEYVDVISIILGCLCFGEYTMIKFTGLITMYPHMFLYDLDSHFDFLLCHIGILTIRNILVHQVSTDSVNTCQNIGFILYAIYIIQGSFLVGITLNIFLFLQFPIAFFFMKFSVLPIGAAAALIIVVFTRDIKFAGFACLPVDSGKFVLYGLCVPMAFVFGFTLVIGIICFFIRGNTYKWEIIGVFIDMVVSGASLTFLFMNTQASQKDNFFLYWFGLFLMFELIVVSLYHICLKKDIIHFYLKIKNRKKSIYRKSRLCTSYFSVS